MKLKADTLPHWPAALNQQMAAAYCGLSVDVFVETCPVKPIAITTSRAGKRYLRQRLDEWLMSLEQEKPKRFGLKAFMDAQGEAKRA